MTNNHDIFMEALRECSPDLAIIVDYVNDYRYRKPTTVKTFEDCARVEAEIYNKLKNMKIKSECMKDDE